MVVQVVKCGRVTSAYGCAGQEGVVELVSSLLIQMFPIHSMFPD